MTREQRKRGSEHLGTIRARFGDEAASEVLARRNPAMPHGVRRAQPNPFGEMVVSLTDEYNAPQVKLYRDREYSEPGLTQLAIVFDERPLERTAHKLESDGWSLQDDPERWVSNHAWVKTIEPTRVNLEAAENYFFNVANHIRRREHGLEPVGNGRSC